MYSSKGYCRSTDIQCKTTYQMVVNTNTPLSDSDGILSPIGPPGPEGVQGVTSMTGHVGPRGMEGQRGVTGPIGNQGITTTYGHIGPPGMTGPQGIQGIQGITGLMGEAGITTQLGATGPTGVTGPPGNVAGINSGNVSYIFTNISSPSITNMLITPNTTKIVFRQINNISYIFGSFTFIVNASLPANTQLTLNIPNTIMFALDNSIFTIIPLTLTSQGITGNISLSSPNVFTLYTNGSINIGEEYVGTFTLTIV